MSLPYPPNLRPGSYASFQALVNDTNDNAVSPVPVAGDCYTIALDGGIDPNGVEVHANDIVMYDGTNWFVIPKEEAANL